MHHSSISDFKKIYYKYIYLIIICSFLATCFVYLIIDEVDKYGFGENRLISTIPTFPPNRNEYLNFPNNFENYLKDNIGFRANLISYYKLINYYAFKDQGSTNVIRGKNDFLYLNQDGNSISDHLGYSSRTKFELEEFANRIQETHDYIESKGIPYVFILVPNKITIFPEYLPNKFMQSVRKARITDQLLDYLKANTSVTIIDLREPVAKTKKICRPYDRFDTHWNYCGATAAYDYTLNQIELLKKFKINKIDYSIVENDTCGWGDLARLYNSSLPGKLIHKCDGFYDYEIKYDDKSCVIRQQDNPNHSQWFYVNLCDKYYQYEKALIFHDSMFSKLSTLFSKSFKETVFFLDRLGQEKLDQEISGSDIVIEQWVERYFNIKGHALY